MSSFFRSAIAVSLVLSLAACAGAAPSSKPAPEAAEGNATVAARPLSGSIQCPQVGIVEDLRSMTLFENNEKPEPQGIMGYAKLEDFSGGCGFENGQVVIDLDVMFAGRIGPRAMQGRTKEPSIAFPYFIAISDNQGNILNKEVFAVALQFRDGMESTHKVEHLKPHIPINNPATAGQYQVLIGFQLNRQQLNFNRGE